MIPPTEESWSRLIDRATGFASGPDRVVLGVAGAPGSGKSTLTEALLAAVRDRLGPETVAHVPMDGYHLADVELSRQGLMHLKGAPQTYDPDGLAALLARLRDRSGRPVYAPGFERTLEQPLAAAISVPPSARLVVTEGNYLLLDSPAWRAVRSCLDEAWFCVADPGQRRSRLVERHVFFGKSRARALEWVDQVDEANAALVEATAPSADLVVAATAIDAVVGRAG